jgi:hypothetical protein
MVKTSELRTGNYVKYTSKTGCSFSRITPIDFEYTIHKDGNFYFDKGLGISFITLTPEILQRCGFEIQFKGETQTVYYKNNVELTWKRFCSHRRRINR